jgi:hypothetical protein
MGWFGYGLYDGDGTQTCHINYINWALPDQEFSEDQIFDFLNTRKTKIPEKYRSAFRKGIPNLLKRVKLPKKDWDEDSAIEWQMLLSLFVDSNFSPPKKVIVYGLLASHYLLGEHCDSFDQPGRRRAAIKRFIKKVTEKFSTAKAQKEIDKRLKHQELYFTLT